MKSDKLKIALETLEGSVPPDTDAVELTGQTARAADGLWWAEATLAEPISGQMTLPYSKFRSIVRALDEKDEIEIEPNGSTCRIKVPDTLWQLSLLNVSTEPLPDFPVINTIEASGYELLEAYRSLKHLMRADLSCAGLMWAWTNEDHQLVIGDGFRLGGYQTDITNLELPLTILSEICRILAVQISEKVIIEMGETQVRATMRDIYFQAMLPKGPRFETDRYYRLRTRLEEDPQLIKMSRSDLQRAINQVGITAGESTLKISQGNGGLILMTRDEYGNISVGKIEALGSLREPISLNIDHLAKACEALTDEMVSIKVCRSAVELSDKKRWEIIIGR